MVSFDKSARVPFRHVFMVMKRGTRTLKPARLWFGYIRRTALLAATGLFFVMVGWPGNVAAENFFESLQNDWDKVVDSVGDALDSVEEGKEDVEGIQQDATTLKDDLTGGGDETPRYDKPWVQEIQTYLTELGYNPGPADGVYGEGTKNAVKAYQTSRGLPADGAPTPALLKALRISQQQQAQSQPPQQLPVDTTSWSSGEQDTASSLANKNQVELTVETQDRLKQLGYNVGVVDGQYGGKTKQAILAFQKDHGFPLTGKVTPELVASLRQVQSETMAFLKPKPGDFVNIGSGLVTSPPTSNKPVPEFQAVGQLGPDMNSVRPATLQDRLVFGYPLTRGKFSQESLQVGTRKESKYRYELMRYMDLAVARNLPHYMEDPDVARIYAQHFLSQHDKDSFLAECQYGCAHSDNFPYAGWAGSNEFEREATWTNFVSHYGPLIAQAGALLPLKVLSVEEVEFTAYDKANAALPFKPRYGTSGLPSDHSRLLQTTADYKEPSSMPALPAEAQLMLEKVPDRRAYLALHLLLEDPKVVPPLYSQPARLRTMARLERAALYADPDLTRLLHEFEIFRPEQNLIAEKSQYRIVQGPGGEELIEFNMPEGFRPIRIASMKGMPVLGFPVKSGAFKTSNWKQHYGFDPEIAISIGGRFGDLLLLSVRPNQLESIKAAEKFAQNHLDKETRALFFPCSITSCQGHVGFGRNEFERSPTHEDFLRKYQAILVGAAPALPFEFLNISQIALGPYDMSDERFQLSGGYKNTNVLIDSQFGGLGESGNRLSIPMPTILPMPAVKAEALVNQIPDRKVYLAQRVVILGFALDQHNRQVIRVEPRSSAIYADAALSQLIYEFSDPKPEASKVAEPAISSKPFRPHYGTLFVLRDVKDVLTHESLAKMTERQISAEQFSLKSAAYQGNDASQGAPVSNFEWQSYLGSKPDLAKGELVELFLDPNAKWDFVERETSYGLAPDHQVNIYLFARSSIEGKLPEFAAQDLAPVFREHLNQAIAKLPKTFFVAARLPKPTYDFEAKELVFSQKSQGSSSEDAGHILTPMKYVNYLSPSEKANPNSYNVAQLNAGDPVAAFYDPKFYDQRIAKSSVVRPPGNSASAEAGPLSKWRSNLESGRQTTAVATVRFLGLDRILELPRIAMDRKKAEQVLAAVQQHGSGNPAIKAVVEFDAERASVAPGAKYATLFAKLRRVLVLDSEGQVIASLGADRFKSAAVAEQMANLGKNQAEEEVLSKFELCEGLHPASEGTACYERLCSDLYQQKKAELSKECRNRLSSFRAAVRKQEQEARALKSQEQQEQRQLEQAERQKAQKCEHQVKSDWGISPGMPLFEEAYKSCLAQKAPAPYGPDIVGLQLGTDRQSADALIKRRMDGDAFARLQEAHPFKQGLLRWSNDAMRGIAVFTINTEGKELVAGISRRLYFDDDKRPDSEQISQGLRKKYGSESWTDNQGTSIWALPSEPLGAVGSDCHELVEFVAPRNGWNRPWVKVVSAAERAEQQKKRVLEQQARSTAYNQCVMEVSAKFDTHSGNGSEENMAKLNKEMAACSEEYGMGGLMLGAEDDHTAEKLPLMIQAEGTPAEYAKYGACGPVVISRLQLDSASKVSDAAFLLIDPSWIAMQPTVAFKAGPGPSADSGGVEIDF